MITRADRAQSAPLHQLLSVCLQRLLHWLPITHAGAIPRLVVALSEVGP